MAKITLDLNTFKASGVYTIEFDASERIVVTTQTIRLVVGFSRIGPINAPVFLRDVNTCRRIFGEIDTYLEKRGSFFHRALETCLSVGPVFALNLMPLKSTPINEGGDATNYRSFALAADEENGPVTRALVTSFYNKERFWFPDTEYVIATQNSKPINRDYLFTVVNLSQAPLSVIARKSVNARQYEVSAKDYYGLGNVPEFMNDNDFLSDFFLDLIVVEGDWTNLAVLSQDPTFSKYFDARGIRADKIDAFLSLDEITLIGAFTGTIIPDFVDNNGSNQNLENIVNAAVGLTGIFIAINNDKIEDYANSVHKIDTIGNTLIGTTDDTIDFLSYNTPIKNILEYTGETDLNTGSADLTVYTNMIASTSDIYVKSYPFGGRSGKFNNVLVIPKPQPGDVNFLPTEYQQILDSATVDTLLKTYGTNTFLTEQPNDFVKVENVIDTGTELQIQLSSPLNAVNGYFNTVVGTGVASAIPTVANTFPITIATGIVDDAGNPVVPAAPAAGVSVDFVLIEAPGYAKYFRVLSTTATTIVVYGGGTAVAGIDNAAPYNFSAWGDLNGFTAADFAAYVQPSDIKITLFKGDLNTATAQANYLVPNLGVTLPANTFGDSMTFAFDPTVTVQSLEGIGNTFADTALATTTAPDSVEVTIYDVTAGALLPGSYWIGSSTPATAISYGGVAGARNATVSFAYDNAGSLDPVASLVATQTYNITLVQSGVTFTGVASSAAAIISIDILELAYIEAYPGSKISQNVANGLLVSGDQVKYATGASQYSYLGVIKEYSKAATTGTVSAYSQVAYGLKGAKISEFTTASLDTRVSSTFASVNQTYIDTTVYNPSATTNDVAVYSSLAKNLASNIAIVGTLFGGGKKFELSNANAANLNVGDLVVDNSPTPKLTRVVNKVKKVNASTGVVTYEYTVLDVPAVNTVTNTITKYTPIQNFCDRLQFTLLNGYVLGDYHLPNNTDAQISKIYGVIENTNIGKTLASRDVISFRYIIDTFNGGIAPQMGPKSILSRLAKNRQKCMALLNAPSIKQFIDSTDPRFTELPDPNAGNPKPVLNTAYIATGGNLSLGPSFTFSLPDEENGAKFIGVFSPNILLRENNKNISVPPAADVSNNFVRKFINGQPYAIVAGPRRGVISNPKYAGLEYEFLLADREQLEPFGINPIVTVKGIGPMIFANQTAYQRTLSAFNNLHVRDLLITVEEAVEDVLAQYLFEFNDASTRLEIRTIVENYLDTVRNAGGVYDYAVIMDETNNTPAIIDQNFGILDIGIEPARGLQKFINRVTILKTGTISSGGFSAA
jgi:hypothetical protein